MQTVLKDFSLLTEGKRVINIGSNETCLNIMNKRENISDILSNFKKDDVFNFNDFIYDSDEKYLVENGYITQSEE